MRQVHHVEPEIEVLPEPPLLDLVPQVLVRGRHDANVHLDRSAAASQPLELLLLEDAKHLGLRGGAHVPDLVEEDGPLVRLLEAADPQLLRAGERPPLVAEQLALEEVLVQRGAIHLHEGALRPGGSEMDERGQQLLPRAGLSRDQHRRRGGSHFPDHRQDLLHPPALGDQRAFIEGVPVLGLPIEFQLSPHPAHPQRRPDPVLKLLHIERLLDVVVRPEPQRLDRRFHGGVGGHQDHLDLGVDLLRFFQYVDAAQIPQPDIGDHHVARLGLEFPDRLLSRGSFLHGIPGLFQRQPDPHAQRVVVFDDQDSIGHCRASSGS